ncbi:hypothetical protein NQ317_018372 [Molorchus minor]|uniref:Uncharacterized protein n=1 Tax=Molorchus minor TaxID=1323400 RepID=A0ABQ9J097_9CUCU|nr:hypothetical protein NQ317_018372 [Molorchus minor]
MSVKVINLITAAVPKIASKEWDQVIKELKKALVIVEQIIRISEILKHILHYTYIFVSSPITTQIIKAKLFTISVRNRVANTCRILESKTSRSRVLLGSNLERLHRHTVVMVAVLLEDLRMKEAVNLLVCADTVVKGTYLEVLNRWRL